MTTKDDISAWFDRGTKEGATHMIIVCDTYDYDEYPVYVTPEESVLVKINEYNFKNMQKVMEVYDLKKDKISQLSEYRVFNI